LDSGKNNQKGFRRKKKEIPGNKKVFNKAVMREKLDRYTRKDFWCTGNPIFQYIYKRNCC
jgi:hypothetical protein